MLTLHPFNQPHNRPARCRRGCVRAKPARITLSWPPLRTAAASVDVRCRLSPDGGRCAVAGDLGGDFAAVVRPAHVVVSVLTPSVFKLQGHTGVRVEELIRSLQKCRATCKFAISTGALRDGLNSLNPIPIPKRSIHSARNY